MSTRPTTLTAAAGEYYVAHKLSVLGYLIGIPRAGTPGIDLLVANQSGSQQVCIQVKTSDWAERRRKRHPEDSHLEWPVGEKGLTAKPNVLYAFVDLKNSNSEHPDVYIVPSKDVADTLTAGAAKPPYYYWLMTNEEQKCKNRWDIIKSLLDEDGTD